MPGIDWKKYPRTFHHPSSPGISSDDKVAVDVSWLDGCDVVITEKMDGENTTLYSDGFHARSLESGFHPSRSWLAGFHGSIAHLIPEGFRICGENLFARHSIAYVSLPSFFLGYSAWGPDDRCLAWGETIELFESLGVTPVPVLFEGVFSTEVFYRAVKGLDTNKQEGLVIRRSESFARQDFPRSVLKWVRKDHVATSTHWRQSELIPNQMAVHA